MSTLSDYLAHVRTTVAALAPDVPGSDFVEASGSLLFSEEPQVADRLFEVTAGFAEVGPYMDRALVERLAPVELRVRYDHAGDRTAGEARIADDALQLAGTLVQRHHYGSARVRLVRFVGQRRESISSHVEDLVLSFEVSCLESLPS